MKFGDETLGLSGKRVTIARIISRTTSAPLINLYVGLIMIGFSPSGLGYLDSFSALIICVLLMVMAPITPIVVEAWRGNVDLDVSIQAMRTRFFTWAILCYILSFIIYALADCVIMYCLSAAYTFVTISVTIANSKSKISVHTAGVSGPSTALIVVFGVQASLIIILWCLVIWSRVVLQQHSVSQSLIGILLGIVFTLIPYGLLYPNVL